jgi:hypothetical protein
MKARSAVEAAAVEKRKNEAQPGLQLVDVRQAATILGLSKSAVKELISAGLLPAIRPPSLLNSKRPMRRVLLDMRDLLAAVERWKTGGVR